MGWTSFFIKNEVKVTWLRLDFWTLLSRWLSYCTWCCFTNHFRRLYIHYYILVWLLSIKVILCLQNTQIRRYGQQIEKYINSTNEKVSSRYVFSCVICFRGIHFILISILFWRVFRFLLMEHKQYESWHL